MQLLRGDLPRGALRAGIPADVVERCTCKEQGNADCRIFTEAWPASLAWLDGAPLASHELAPCPAAPHFRMQFFHMYHDWIHTANTRDTMVLVRARHPAPNPAASPACASGHGAEACLPVPNWAGDAQVRARDQRRSAV